MNNVIDATHVVKKLKKIRYIIDESFGSTNNEFNTSWIEIQAYNSVHNNVAEGKKVVANFHPMMDVTGQSDLSTITNGQISQREWVSCNISLAKQLPAKVIIDLEKPISDLTTLYFYHEDDMTGGMPTTEPSEKISGTGSVKAVRFLSPIAFTGMEIVSMMDAYPFPTTN